VLDQSRDFAPCPGAVGAFFRYDADPQFSEGAADLSVESRVGMGTADPGAVCVKHWSSSGRVAFR